MRAFKNKIVVVTGGSSGIGQAISQLLASHGATVIIASRSQNKLMQSVDKIIAAGGQAESETVDVTDAQAVANLVSGVVSKYGQLDYLFNNAGTVSVGELRDFSTEDFDRIIDVNVRGVYHGVMAAYPIMIKQGFGHIINTASLAGLVPSPGLVAYSASKHALVGLSTSLRSEAKAYGVKVCVACPGFIDTPFITEANYINVQANLVRKNTPVPFFDVDNCARDIVKGVAKNKAVILVSGHAKLASFFYRHFPKPVYRVSEILSNRLHEIRGKEFV